jgi:hypothetical protein
MIVTIDRIFCMPTAYSCRCAARMASGLELALMERSLSSS